MDKSKKINIFDIDIIIFGYKGQDGSILCNQIYERKPNSKCLLISRNSVTLRRGDLYFAIANHWSKNQIMQYLSNNLTNINPKVVYYFAAEHQSAEQADRDTISGEKLMYTNYELPCAVMNRCKELNHKVKFIYTSSALIFANSKESPQNEETEPIPKCDYGFSKLQASQQLKDISDNSNIQFYNLIMYGHESTYRRNSFFTKKLISHLAKIKGEMILERLTLYNPDQKLDIGYAPEYIEIMQMLIDKSVPGDYIIASGLLITVKAFTMACCEYFGINHDDAIAYSSLEKRSSIQLHGNISKLKDALNYTPRINQEKLAYQLCQDYDKKE